jgi:hypothetical protein
MAGITPSPLVHVMNMPLLSTQYAASTGNNTQALHRARSVLCRRWPSIDRL